MYTVVPPCKSYLLMEVSSYFDIVETRSMSERPYGGFMQEKVVVALRP